MRMRVELLYWWNSLRWLRFKIAKNRVDGKRPQRIHDLWLSQLAIKKWNFLPANGFIQHQVIMHTVLKTPWPEYSISWKILFLGPFCIYYFRELIISGLILCLLSKSLGVSKFSYFCQVMLGKLNLGWWWCKFAIAIVLAVDGLHGFIANCTRSWSRTRKRTPNLWKNLGNQTFGKELS